MSKKDILKYALLILSIINNNGNKNIQNISKI